MQVVERVRRIGRSVVPAKAEPILRNVSGKAVPEQHLERSLAQGNLHRGYGSPEFTNEVQHFLEGVLPWGGTTASFHWKTDARLPSFKKPGIRSGKSLQLWIARHQRLLGS